MLAIDPVLAPVMTSPLELCTGYRPLVYFCPDLSFPPEAALSKILTVHSKLTGVYFLLGCLGAWSGLTQLQTKADLIRQ
jgi:hypothetical protein